MALSSPATFAAFAKLERRILALDKEASALKEQRETAQARPIVRLPGQLRTALSIGVLLMALMGRSVACVEPEAVWPVGWLLALGRSSGDGCKQAVGVIAWSFLCRHVSGRAVDAFQGALL